MKKMLCLALALALVLSLSACLGGKKGGEDPVPAPPAPSGQGEQGGPQGEGGDQAATEGGTEKVTVSDDGKLAPAMEPRTGLWGYISRDGEWVIEPQYSTAYCFTEDLAAAADKYGEWAYIDRRGVAVIDSVDKFSLDAAGHFSGGITAVLLERYSEGELVVINKDGEMIKSAASISREMLPPSVEKTPFKDANGCTLIMRDGFYGLADEMGVTRLECKYRRISHCEGDIYAVCSQNGFWGFADLSGKEIVPCEYSDALPFSEGVAAVKYNGYWGFVDEWGDWVIDPVYTAVRGLKAEVSDDYSNRGAFCEGLAAVRDEDGWNLINKKGEPLFADAFAPVEFSSDDCPFRFISDGMIVCAERDAATKETLCCLYTTEGGLVTDPVFSMVLEFR